MTAVDSVLAGRDGSAAVRAIYFALRYLKQAAGNPGFDKDVFQDSTENLPTEEVRELAWGVIHAVESELKLTADQLDRPTLSSVIGELSAKALSYSQLNDAEAVAEADQFLAEISK